MKTKSKIAIAAAATLLAGVAVASLPAAAHDRTGSTTASAVSSSKHERAHATASATVTGIPAAVTSSRQASHGAYFTVYQLSASATAVPSAEPNTGGKRIGIRPERGSTEPAISGSTLTATLGFPATAGSSKYALYPSDGTSAILVTVNVSEAGVTTVTSSRVITVAYSATVAAEHQLGAREGAGDGKHDGGKRDGHKGKGKGKGKGGKPEGGKGHGPRH